MLASWRNCTFLHVELPCWALTGRLISLDMHHCLQFESAPNNSLLCNLVRSCWTYSHCCWKLATTNIWFYSKFSNLSPQYALKHDQYQSWYLNAWIMREWTPGWRYVKGSPPLLHRSETPRLKETQNVLHLFRSCSAGEAEHSGAQSHTDAPRHVWNTAPCHITLQDTVKERLRFKWLH